MSELFAKIPFDVIGLTTLQDGKKGKLDYKTLAMYVIMAKHADFQTGEFYLSRKTLAAEMGLKDHKAVDAGIKDLTAAGLLSVQQQWKDRDGNHSFTKDAQYCIKSTGYFKLLRPPESDGDPADEGGGGKSAIGVGVNLPYGVGVQMPYKQEPSNNEIPSNETAPAATVPSESPPQPGVDAVIAESERLAEEAKARELQRLLSLPDWVTDDHRRAAEEKQADLVALTSQTAVEAKYSKPRYLSALLERVPVAVGGRCWEE